MSLATDCDDDPFVRDTPSLHRGGARSLDVCPERPRCLVLPGQLDKPLHKTNTGLSDTLRELHVYILRITGGRVAQTVD
jgi:hypothetical protein